MESLAHCLANDAKAESRQLKAKSHAGAGFLRNLHARPAAADREPHAPAAEGAAGQRYPVTAGRATVLQARAM